MKYCVDCIWLKGSNCVRPTLGISAVTGEQIKTVATNQRYGYSEGYYLKDDICGMQAKYFAQKPYVEPYVEVMAWDTPWT